MILLYEVRVLVAWLYARYLRARAEALKDAATRAADTQKALHEACLKADGKDPTLLAHLTLATKEMKEVESDWERWEGAASRAEATADSLAGRKGRAGPALLGGFQAWAAAAVLSYKCPGWAVWAYERGGQFLDGLVKTGVV